MQDFNIFDVIIISITLLLGLKGLFRGFIKEAFGLIGIVGGIFVASRISKDVGDIIAPVIGIDSSASVSLIGFIASLIGFWIVAYFIGMIISKISSLSGLGIFDRVLGFVFGTGKIFFIFSIIIYALSQVEAIKEKLETKIGSSIMYPILLESGNYIVKLDTTKLGNNVTKVVDEAVESTKESIQDITQKSVEEKIEEVKETIKDKINKE